MVRPPPRSRKRPKRVAERSSSQSPPPPLVFILSIVAISWIVCCNLGSEETNSNQGRQNLFQQCENSCTQIILSHVNETSVELSAVDALFQLLDEDSNDSTILSSSSSASSSSSSTNKSTTTTTTNKKENKTFNHVSNDYLYRNIGPRPTSLPPLIETLVGTVGTTHPTSNVDTSKLIIPPSKKSSSSTSSSTTTSTTTNNNESSNTNTGRNPSTEIQSDDSVVMAAAAAAAAVWSQEEGRNQRGKLRMKTFNEEWESALKWIASWDTTTTTTGGSGGGSKPQELDASMKQQQEQQRHSSDKGRRKSRGNSNGKSNKEYPQYSVLKGDELKLLNTCIEKCMGDKWDPSSWDAYIQNNGHDRGRIESATTAAPSSSKQRSSSIRPWQRIWTRMTALRIRFLSPIHQDVIGGFIAMMIVLFVRNLLLDIRLRKHTKSLQLLLEEERMIDDQNHSRSFKKSKKSKKKRKEGGVRPSRDDRHHSRDFLQKGAGGKSSSTTAWKELEHDEDDVDDQSTISEGSVEYIYFHNTKAPQDEKKHRKQQQFSYHQYHSEDHATTTSKENTSSTSSFVTEDSDYPEEVKYSSTSTISHNHHTSKIQSKQNRRPTENSAVNSSLVKNNRQEKRSPTSSCKSSPTTTHARPSQNHVFSRNIKVPTPEQREEASRKLREYQKAQIEKIKQYQMQSTAATTPPRTTTASSPNRNAWNMNNLNVPVSSPAATTATQPLSSLPTTNPPPGFTVDVKKIETNKSETIDKSFSSESNQVGSLLLGLLDEDEEDNQDDSMPIETCGRNLFSAESSSNNSIALGALLRNDRDKEPSQNPEFKMNPIELGDLLAGHLCSNNVTASTTTCSSNPWQNDTTNTTVDNLSNPHNDNCTITTTKSSLFDGSKSVFETESVSELSASARVFSPSWEEGINKGDI